MGVDESIHMGPVVICKNPQVPDTEKETVCPNCKVHLEANYCGECGHHSSTSDKQVMVSKVDSWGLIDELGETITNIGSPMGFPIIADDIDVYISNVKKDPPCEVAVSDVDIVNINLSDVDIATHMELFKDHFANELKTIRERYGEENVELSYRLIRYYW